MKAMSFTTPSAQSTKDPMLIAPKSLQSERYVPAMDGKLENRLTIRDLERLRRSFMVEGEGYHGKVSLTKDQFCEALSMLLKKGTVEEYAQLFDKIDFTKEGSVDWDSLASYLMLEYYEKDDRSKSSQVPQWKDIKILASPHKETIQRVSYLKNTNRYIAVSKEGCISWWSTDLKLQWSLKTGTDTIKMKDVWVTHCVPFQNINKMALAFTSKEIAIYDLSSKNEINSQYKIQGLHFTPLCLDYWYNPDNANDAVLVWGDVGGFINIIFFSSANIALFERPPAPANEKQEPCLNVQLKDVISGRYKNATHAQYDAHIENNKGEWVRKVLYSHHLECFISCATTNSSSLVIGWMEKHASVIQRREQPTKREIQRKFQFNVPQGVNDFDFNENLNLIATAGANNHVCLWNPYVVSKPNGILKGHMASVVQVQFVPARNQLLSFSKDKVFRIWDVQLQVCIQRLAGMFPKGHVEAVSYLFFDDGKDRDGHERNKLFLTFNHQMTAMDMKTEVRDRIVSHERPVVAAIYNSLYSQVVSVCQVGTIIMWLIDTGQKVKQFSKAHGSSEVTCLTQDQSETRLFTGSTDGTVKIWDFNGHCYHNLECAGGQPADIGQILVLKRSVVVVGWARCITVFRNSALKEFHVKPSEWKGGQEHAEDILSCAFMSPNTLATGSYDGEIVIWNTNSEHASRHCAHRSRRNLKSRGQNLTTSLMKESSSSSGSKHALDEKKYRLSELSRNNFKRSAKSRSVTSLSLKTTDEQGDFGWAVVRLIFLENRRNMAASSSANLVSCGDSGWVRFWNTAQCTLAAEYVAHENVGSIIMATDQSNHFIVTADAEGFVKVWDIQEYAVSPVGQPITDPPLLTSQFQPHEDQINSLEILDRNGRLLIISASSDCTVALWDINGIRIGTFGQEEHWKVEPYQAVQEKKAERKPQKEEDSKSFAPSVEVNEDSLWEPCIEAITEPHKYRLNTWDKTVLGKQYQRLRVQKRERKQPSTIPDLPYLQWEKTGALLAGPYSALQTQELKPVQTLMKPDTEKYFHKRPHSGQLFQTKLPALAETLTTSFDEKSMFPSYILEFEKKMKNYHIVLLNQNQPKRKNEPSAIQNIGSQNGQMGTTVPVFTHRNTSSKGSVGLKVQPVSGIKKSSASTSATFTAD